MTCLISQEPNYLTYCTYNDLKKDERKPFIQLGICFLNKKLYIISEDDPKWKQILFKIGCLFRLISTERKDIEKIIKPFETFVLSKSSETKKSDKKTQDQVRNLKLLTPLHLQVDIELPSKSLTLEDRINKKGYDEWENSNFDIIENATSNQYRDVLQNSFLNNFFNLYKDDSLCEKIKQLNVLHGRCFPYYETSVKTAILDYPNLAFLYRRSLEEQAAHYFNKYHIVIRCVDYSSLEELLSELNQVIKYPTYLGIVLGRFKGAFRDQEAHVVPLLCYFDGSQNTKNNQCLILDSAKMITKYTLDDKIKHVFVSENVYDTRVIRQADQFSCRQGAMIILRNALLSLKYYQMTNGFNHLLVSDNLTDERTSVEISNDNNRVIKQQIVQLPFDWIYTEQKVNIPIDNSSIVIRSKYSKVLEKRNKQETVSAFRKRFSKSVRMKTSFEFTLIEEMKSEFLEEKSQPIKKEFLSQNRELKPTLLTVNLENQKVNITIEMSKKINVYLLVKGLNDKTIKHA